ncbi:MAG TPA: GNAT family N-acetyltransferase [Chloroflexota bacterium]|jgi:RimJ/RimL family protein N-acetyltransferase|nr:GNAT family N-acetyltransferase [Chloroflexota bacterium]
MTAMPSLETERLLIRPFGLEDLDACRRVMDGGPSPDRPTRSARRRWLRWTVLSYGELAALRQPPYGDRAIVLKDTGAVVGAVGFVPSLMPFGQLPSFRADAPGTADRLSFPEVGLFWTLAPEHRGHGYATEAAAALIGYGFRELRLRRIVATTSYDNVASMAVMRRLGMRIDRNPHPDPRWLQVVGVLDHPPV